MSAQPGSGPRVTVVMAAYDASATILAALESIRGQQFTDWELVVVDDGSRDDTGRVLDEFAAGEPRVRILHQAQNVGLAASLNAGIAAARGEYIARMDADDRALPERLGVQVAFLDARPDVDILGGGAREMNGAGELLGELQPRAQHEVLAARIYTENPFIHPTVMMRREVLEALGGYDASFRRGQDYELWLRAYRQFRFHNLQQPLIWYLRRSNPRWRDARFSSRVILHALRREGRVARGAWFVARPLAATAWERVTRHVRGRA